jgi:cell division protein FtsB
MRYWGTESRVSQTAARTRARTATRSTPTTQPSQRKTTKPTTRSKVAGPGSVQPFLRKVYRHQSAISGPIQRVLLLLGLAGVLYAFVLGDSGAIRIAILRHQRAQVDHDIAELKHNVALLENEIQRLEDDAFYIEKLGRERYGYIKPGERVIKIVTPPHEDN